MKQTFLTLLLALLLGMPGVEALAYDIAVNNADDVTIYYNYVDNSTALEVTHNGSLGRSYKGDVVIPQSVYYGGKNYSVTSIGMGAFYMCSEVTSVTIPSSVTSIGEEAFYGFTLSKINVEAETPPTLGRLAFSNYDAMVYVPRSSKEQYKAAWSGFSNFYDANDIAVENAQGVTIYYNYVNNKSALEVTYRGGVALDYPKRYTGSIVIPETVDYKGKTYPVTGIGEGAFYFCSSLTSVTLPSSLTSIGEYAFYGCTGLEQLDCRNSNLTSLDVSGCTALTALNCQNNKLTSLNVSGCKALKWLYCFNNQLASLDVSGCTALIALNCRSNKLTSLDVVNNKALTRLFCFNNQIQGSGMATLVNGLPTVASGTGTFEVYNDNGTDDNEITNAQVERAKAKNWRVTTSSGNDYAGYDVVAINASNFPDTNFREWLLEQSYGEDGYLSPAEIAEVTSINVNNKNISDLKGIRYFTALTTLKCWNNQLTSLDVSKNAALTWLTCGDNQLTSLDVSKNTALTTLKCYDNQLTSLDVSKNTALTDLYCYNNKLTSLDVSKNTALTDLYCANNQLTSLDVSKNKALTYLAITNNQIQGAGMATLIENLPTVTNGEFYVYNTDGTDGNRITTAQVAAAKAKGWSVKTKDGDDYAGVDPGIAIDATNFPDEKFREYVSTYCDKDKDTYLSDEEIAAVTEIYVYRKSISDLKGIEYFTALKTLDCGSNKLTTLDVSKNTALTELTCDVNQLTTLDVSKNTALTNLSCGNNQLTSLDVSKNTALTSLSCGSNQLASLDVSKNTALKGLGCNNNQLTSLDVSKNTVLTDLYCYDNQLTALNLSKNTALTMLVCNRNQLTSLDVSKNTALKYLHCVNNQIRGAGMATLIENLPTVTNGEFHVYNTNGTDGNRITTVQVAAAKAKGWNVRTTGDSDYPGINVPGDANGDGEVNATDITTVRDYILGLDPKPFSLESANLNGDSAVNIADLTKLIQLLTE